MKLINNEDFHHFSHFIFCLKSNERKQNIYDYILNENHFKFSSCIFPQNFNPSLEHIYSHVSLWSAALLLIQILFILFELRSGEFEPLLPFFGAEFSLSAIFFGAEDFLLFPEKRRPATVAQARGKQA